MFRGASTLTMDVKGRVAIPSRYRESLLEQCGGRMVMTVNNTNERCLWLYALDTWEEVEKKVVALPSFDPAAQALKRFLIGYASDCELDANGRVRVVAPLQEFAGLGKRVVLIGQGNKFEIWDEAGWKAKCDTWLQSAESSRIVPENMKDLSL